MQTENDVAVAPPSADLQGEVETLEARLARQFSGPAQPKSWGAVEHICRDAIALLRRLSNPAPTREAAPDDAGLVDAMGWQTAYVGGDSGNVVHLIYDDNRAACKAHFALVEALTGKEKP